MPRRLRLSLAAALFISAVLACENSPFEPKGEGERVPIGQEITDEVGSNSTAHYSFVGEPGAAYAIFLEALSGTASLIVYDSTHLGFVVANVFAGPGSPPLYQNATQTMATNSGAVYNFLVAAVSPGTSTHYRFLVYRINQDPELREGRFNLGDTVSGETIDPIVDQDEFIMRGDAGQEFVAVAETQGPPGSGSVALNVVDPVQYGLFGYVFADAGTPTLTTGRLRFPATQDYRFYFGSVLSNVYPRYSGPYRFWTYLINRAPEHRSAALPRNAQVADERIDREGDIDEFTFAANTGDEFNVFVQAPRAFQLEVARQGTGAFALATAVPADTALYLHSTGRFSATQTGTYVVRVLGDGSHQIADTGSYRVYVYAVDRRPEQIPAVVAIGDTVSGEQIELPGDIDEFTFSGTAGEEINAFFQAEDGSQGTWLQLDVLQSGGTVLHSVQSVGTDTSLFRQATGAFVLPSTGTYRIRVQAPPQYQDHSRGPYRFFLYRINRAPEHAPATLALGDSITGETIDLPGDIDEFTFRAPQTTLAGFALARTGTVLVPWEQCLHFTLVADDGHQIMGAGVPAYCGTTTENFLGTGPVAVPAGVHTLRVQGVASTGAGYVGPYRLVAFLLDSLPESTVGSIAVGDTVNGEAIDRPGDYDVFTFSGRKGQHIDVHIQGLATGLDSSQYWFSAALSGPAQGLGWVSSPASSASLDAHRTGRIDLLATGIYRLTVSSGHGGTLLDEVGSYRFSIMNVPAGPETAAVGLAVGDSVTAERMDSPEDVDEFVLTGSPAQEVAVFLHAGETQGMFVEVYDTTTGDIIGGTPSYIALESTGRFRLPASGVAGIRVYSGRGGMGSYFLKVVAINRAPENVPSAVIVGDTVEGEAIDPRGDIDEFTVTGTQGQSLIAYLQTPQGSQYPGLVLQVIDTTSGAVLGSVASLNPTPTLEDQSTGSIVLPYSGAYTIRVEGASDRNGAGAYRFKIVLQ